jgi:hypothetical protein
MGSELNAGFREYSKMRPSLSPWNFHAGLRSSGACADNSASSTFTRYWNADAALCDTDARSTVNSSDFSSETGWMNVLFGPMASSLEVLLIRMVSVPVEGY